jgi:predicted acetyltransferase
MVNDVRLIEPALSWQTAFLEMAAEFAAISDRRYQAALDNFASCFRCLQQRARGDNLPPGRVRETIYWGLDGSALIGSIRLRHELTPRLQEIGGHIGYEVRPSRRRQGYGTQMLALTLDRARQFGLPGVLITCGTDNHGSARMIEKNGGTLTYRGMIEGYTKPISRYWIDLPAGA